MRIVVDLQGAQTDSRFRGIGRYSMNFAKALIRNRGSDTVIIALNAMFPDRIGPIRASLDGLLPQANIVVWDAPGPVAERDLENQRRRNAAELVRETFLANLEPDVVHLTSLFEGYVDNAVTSIGRCEAHFPTFVTLYDLIPFLNQQEYLQSNSAYADHYLRKTGHLRRAHTLLAISASAGEEAINALGWDPKRMVTVGTGNDERFAKTCIPPEQERTLRARFGLELPFFMYVSAPDAHKNHRRLIEAYAQISVTIRRAHRLALVGRFSEHDRRSFEKHAAHCGLGRSELVLINGVSDEDLNALYNLAKGFVIPSLHEGFGLPAVEAMQCGRAVIGSRTASLPDVIGRDDALFDPFDTGDIVRAMTRLAIDDVWRDELEAHAVAQARLFDWDTVAQRALAAMKDAHSSCAQVVPRGYVHRRPRLAFVSPLPPARSGISEYSAELLPDLARYYDIDLVVDQPLTDDRFISANFPIRSVEWLRENADKFERIVYQFGNSTLHAHMFRLLEEQPGVVILHDFFLSAVQAERRFTDSNPDVFVEALEASHGYQAIRDVGAGEDVSGAIQNYPANLPVLQNALGVIVHSEHARQLARDWYGPRSSLDWIVIPLLRAYSNNINRAVARAELSIRPDDLLVCSFGFLDPVKLNHRLIDAWIASTLSEDVRARLVFVGQNHDLEYGMALSRQIRKARCGKRIHITGWTDTTIFRRYLAAADIGVQLRTNSRGEMSATVLDCMNHGLATVVNAHGAMAELNPTAVWMLPDVFTDAELSAALTALAGDRGRRIDLGSRAQSIILTQHAPRRCAEQYATAIETIYSRAKAGLHGLTQKLRSSCPARDDGLRIATALARNFPPVPRSRQLLVDVSALVRTDLKTGVERVTRAILHEWLTNPPTGWRIEPVYATEDTVGYRYARQFSCRFLGIPEAWSEDTVVEAWADDVFVGLDFQPYVTVVQKNVLQDWHNRGIVIWFLVHDLLPISKPQFFPENAAAIHQHWLETITQFDGAVCVSQAVAEELRAWLRLQMPEGRLPPSIKWIHNGANIERSVPTRGLPDDAESVIASLRSRPSFLLVGTIEPRKGHLQAIKAFDLLWQEHIDVNLVIVGSEGWRSLADSQRRTIPAIANALRSHSERGRRLFWLEGISDEYLERIYDVSTCLIAASEGEGFGLPLIESAQRGLPILVRDIPVFREIAGDGATYFTGLEATDLAEALAGWLKQQNARKTPDSTQIPWQTWSKSAQDLLERVGVVGSVVNPPHCENCGSAV